MTLFLLVLVAALAFEFVNGFHDAANAIATSVSTRVLTPRQAIMLAAVCNLLGAFWGTAVAKTIGQGLVDHGVLTMQAVFAALLAGIIWNLFTWWLGLPSSSSHALIGGLIGAAVACAGNWQVVIWSRVNGVKHEGLWPKVILPMFISPLVGFVVAGLLMLILLVVCRKMTPTGIRKSFGRLQILSSAFMGFSHGTNDAQKTMGIIALALFTGTQAGAFNDLPPWLHFLNTPKFEISFWVIAICALTMALGTAGGGWRIIRTMGKKMIRMQTIHGFAAQTTASGVIAVASVLGIPLSTTHVISSSVMGVGATKRLSAVKWGVVGRIVWAWVLTIPITALLGWLIRQALPS